MHNNDNIFGNIMTTNIYFKLVNNNYSEELLDIRILYSRAKQAANKFSGILFNEMKKDKIKFSIVKYVEDRPEKIYKYIFERKKLSEPLTVKFGGNTVVYVYRNSVIKDTEP